MLTNEQILEKKDIKTVKVPVPEWGDSVIVSEMSGSMRDQFERQYANLKTQGEDDRYFRSLYVAFSVVDGNGDLMFGPEDIEKISRKNGKALDRIFEASEKLNNIFFSAENEAKN